MKFMKKIPFLLALMMTVLAQVGHSQNWTLDKAHAKLGFTVTHMMISDVEGFLKSFDIHLTASKDDFSDATIEATADINSINTDNEQRDTHLKSADFFDVATYPALSFKSTSFTKTGDNKYLLKGDLTMHGITKPVELDVILKGTTIHPYTKKLVAGFKVSGVIKRSDFGIGAKFPTAMVSDEVTITANAEFSKD